MHWRKRRRARLRAMQRQRKPDVRLVALGLRLARAMASVGVTAEELANNLRRLANHFGEMQPLVERIRKEQEQLGATGHGTENAIGQGVSEETTCLLNQQDLS